MFNGKNLQDTLTVMVKEEGMILMKMARKQLTLDLQLLSSEMVFKEVLNS